ncbi:MAG TPA: extracellular solute-binding protein [Candidatus Paceibacterota bacterium]
MNPQSSIFQMILMVVAGIVALGAILVFAFYRPDSGAEGAAAVVWGTLPTEIVTNTLVKLQGEGEPVGRVTYVEKDAATFDRELTDAIANDQGPDVILIEAGQLIRHSLRIVQVPYATVPLRDFRDTYATAETWAGSLGTYGVPFLLDPLVLYYNTAALASAGQATVPEYWDQVIAIAPKLTRRGENLALAKSAIGLGEYQNVTHAKEIIYALSLQAGTPIVSRLTPAGETDLGLGDRYDVYLGARFEYPTPPADAALLFFTQFVDPSKDVYTWNRSLPSTRDRFLSGDLAMYLGLASERGVLRQSNPNLPFDLAVLPQSRSRDTKATYARSYALAIVRTAKDPAAAYAAIQALTGEASQRAFAAATGLAPSRRALLGAAAASRAEDAAVYASAIVAQPVLEPDPEGMSGVVGRMVEAVTSGRSGIDAAVDFADRSARELLPVFAKPEQSAGAGAAGNLVPSLAPTI